jgi:hypothetical protein
LPLIAADGGPAALTRSRPSAAPARAAFVYDARMALPRAARWLPSLILLLLLGLLVARQHWRADTRTPLVVDPNRVTVNNTTDEGWRNVEIWVNSYYRATSASLDAHARLDAPLNRFISGHSRPFDASREAVRGVEVTATSASGAPVKLVWGEGRTYRGSY